MLNDRERSRLCEIERQLEQDDPRFAMRMRHPRPAGLPRWSFDITIFVSAVLALICLVTPGAAGAGIVSAVLCAVALRVRCQRYPRRPHG